MLADSKEWSFLPRTLPWKFGEAKLWERGLLLRKSQSLPDKGDLQGEEVLICQINLQSNKTSVS